jgi:hypothetical protein
VSVFCRETTLTLPELERRGEVFFQEFYGETATNVQALLDKIYPDMGTHAMLSGCTDRVLKRLHRVVQQHDCIWISIWASRNLDSTGDLVRLNRYTHRGRHPSANRLAS